ncbi:MAG: hypothetical protein QOJ41_944, partial [Acidobacteriaceae bacterium]|nr:hypothetical protein [Acidobacteriaceae bacterium]
MVDEAKKYAHGKAGPFGPDPSSAKLGTVAGLVPY